MSAEEYKQKGNTALQSKDFAGAIENYTKGLEIEPTNHLLLTNRAAVYLQQQKFQEALDDSTKAVTSKPDFGKAYLRQGQALFGLSRLEEAVTSLQKGTEVEPTNAQITKQLQEVQARLEQQEQSTKNPFSQLFNAPDFWTKLQMNPELSVYLQQPDFVQKVQELQKNPNKINESLQDPRIMKLLMSLLNMKGMVPPEEGEASASNDKMQEDTHDHSGHDHDHDHDHSGHSHAQPEKKPEPKKQETKAPTGNQEALAEKEKGNALFKQKKFDEALVHYVKAAELDPNDITYRLNKAAVYIEQGKFDEAVQECQEAVDYGRANRADFKTIGRALERMGNAYFRQKNFKEAIKCYGASLVEEPSREVQKKKQQAEQLLAKQIEDEYKSPEKAEEARLRGNELFKENKFPEAMKEYNDAIKRDASKPNYYFNRCVCYLKLGEPNYALKDADKAIELDPKYVKAMARKAQCHIMRKEYHRAVDTYKHALSIDAENAEIKEGLTRVTQLIQSKSSVRDEDRVRMAMQDNEIMMIMNDPIMKQVLSDFSENPREAQKHLKNQNVLGNIEKLIAAGVIQTG